jgi:hypothetical protein
MTTAGDSTGESSGDRTLLVLSPDLMLGARVEAAARSLGVRAVDVASAAGIRPARERWQPIAAVLDLAAPTFPLEETMAALEQDGEGRPFVLALFPHVQAELGRAARRAGCTLVVPRSRFMAELPELLRRATGLEAARTSGAGHRPGGDAE